MNRIHEPDDVDFIVGDVEPTPRASAETTRAIEAYKSRPEYRREAEDAARILEDIGINLHDYGMRDAESLLAHWRRCVADLTDAGRGDTNGINGDHAIDPGGNVGSTPGM